jgi:imidazolonepropionase-like amidohydrolase
VRYLLKADRVRTPDPAGGDTASGDTVGADTGADTIAIDGDRITAVGSYADLAAGAPGAEVIDLPGLVLSPGFIDTHVHITGNGTVTAPVEIQRASPETLLLRAAGNAQAALAEGVTTVRDLGAPTAVIVAFRDAATAGLFPAPHILVAGAPLTRTGGHGHWWGLEADTDDEVRTAVRRQSKAGVDALKVMVDGGIDLGRHIPGLLYFKPAELRLAVEEAHDWGMRVAAHCLTADGVRSAVHAGVDSVEHAIFYELELDDTRYDRDTGAMMAERGIYVDPGPAFAYEVFTGPGAENSTFAKNARLFRRRLEDNARMHEQQVKLVAGSDAGWFGTPFGQYALIPRLLVTESGLSPRAAFDACTSTAAESLGLGAETGSIRPGLRADIVALDGDPVTDITAMARVRLTMVGGQIRYDGRSVLARGLAPLTEVSGG